MNSNSVELWKSSKNKGQLRMVISGPKVNLVHPKVKKKIFMVSSVAEAKSIASKFLQTTQFDITTVGSDLFDEPEQDEADLIKNLDEENNVNTNDVTIEAQEEHGLTPPREEFTSSPVGSKRKLPEWILDHLDNVEENYFHASGNNNEVTIDLTGVDSDENENYPDIVGDILNDSWDASDFISDNSSSISLSQPSPTNHANSTPKKLLFKSVSDPSSLANRPSAKSPRLSSNISSSQPPQAPSSRPTHPGLEYEIQLARMMDQEMVGNAGGISHDRLTNEQKEVAKDVLSGSNVFITGPAGTGKSFLFQYLIQELSARYGDNAVAVTAPTGVAAVNVNGVTIHSFAGIGLGKGDQEELFQKVLGSSKARRNWSRTKVLMIDEISMLGSELFTKLANIGARLKELEGKNNLPFGGIQVVLCGDFYQLPPVKLGSKQVGSFAFTSPAWKELNVKMWQLTHIIRQNDREFINILNTLRLGQINQSIIDLLGTCHVAYKPPPDDDIVPTKLMCVNKDVDAENNKRLKELKGEETVMAARDKIVLSFAPFSEERLKEDIEKKVPGKLALKIGAQVVLVRNVDVLRKLVNGTRGVVVGFQWEHLEPNRETSERISGTFWCPVIKWDCGFTEPLHPRQFRYKNRLLGLICREQFPLKLAWSLTVHKSQGMTLSRAQITVGNAFENGQVYVALSRCVSLDGLWMSGASLSQRAVKAHPKVKEFYK